MVKKRKKTVLKISTGHKALPYRNDKNGKTQKSFQKGDAQAKSTMNGIAKKKNFGTNQTHVFSLSFNAERSVLPNNND